MLKATLDTKEFMSALDVLPAKVLEALVHSGDFRAELAYFEVDDTATSSGLRLRLMPSQLLRTIVDTGKAPW